MARSLYLLLGHVDQASEKTLPTFALHSFCTSNSKILKQKITALRTQWQQNSVSSCSQIAKYEKGISLLISSSEKRKKEVLRR